MPTPPGSSWTGGFTDVAHTPRCTAGPPHDCDSDDVPPLTSSQFSLSCCRPHVFGASEHVPQSGFASGVFASPIEASTIAEPLPASLPMPASTFADPEPDPGIDA